jgi:hypothetical protein
MSASTTNYYPTGIVPEPGTMVLTGLSAVMMALWRIRRQRSARVTSSLPPSNTPAQPAV